MLQNYWIGYIACAAAIMIAMLTAMAIKPTGAPRTTTIGLRNSAMDGARGYLAIAVFIYHFGFAYNHLSIGMWVPPSEQMFSYLGTFAVMVFFMITAYLFYGRISRLRNLSDWVGLYIGRFFRIAPMYLVSVTLAIYALFAFDGFSVNTMLHDLAVDTAQWLALGWNINPPWNGNTEAYIANAGVTWTLRYEWLFYFSLPALAVFVHLVRWRWLRIMAITALAVASAFLPTQVAFGFQSNIAALFLGGILAWEILQFEGMRKFASSWIAAVIGLGSVYANLFLPRLFPAEQVLTAFIFFVPIASGNGYFGIMTNRSALVLGEISFGIYLLHGIVLFVALRVLAALSILPQGAAAWLLLPALTVPLVLLSICGHRLVEAPGIDAGKRIADRLRRSTMGTVEKPTST